MPLLKLLRNVVLGLLVVVVAALAFAVAILPLLVGVVLGAALAIFKTAFAIGHDSVVEALGSLAKK